jgi:hypothetical protein
MANPDICLSFIDMLTFCDWDKMVRGVSSTKSTKSSEPNACSPPPIAAARIEPTT